MPKPAPPKYHTSNWREYNAELQARGSLLIWLDKDMARSRPWDRDWDWDWGTADLRPSAMRKIRIQFWGLFSR